MYKIIVYFCKFKICKIRNFREVDNMESFKDRLAHILRSKNLTGSQFAGLVGIQPSNVSHLLSGRNNPSLDFLVKLKETFPEYNFDWLIMGKKPITSVDSIMPKDNTTERSADGQMSIDIVDEKNENIGDIDIPLDEDTDNQEEDDEVVDKIVENHRNKNLDNPRKIFVMYEDNTFEVFRLRK